MTDINYTAQELIEEMQDVTDGQFTSTSTDAKTVIREFVTFCFDDEGLTDEALASYRDDFTDWSMVGIDEHGLDIINTQYYCLTGETGIIMCDYNKEDVKPEYWSDYGFGDEEELMAA